MLEKCKSLELENEQLMKKELEIEASRNLLKGIRADQQQIKTENDECLIHLGVYKNKNDRLQQELKTLQE